MKLSQIWSPVRLTTRISLSFAIMLIILMTNIFITHSSMTIISRANNQIFESIEIQRLANGISRNWETLRRVRHDFFYTAPVVGYEQAYKLYALPSSAMIADIIRSGVSLNQDFASPGISPILTHQKPAIQDFLTKTSQYAELFQKSTDLESRITSSPNGLKFQLVSKGDMLLEALVTETSDPRLLESYYELRSREKEYVTHRGNRELPLDSLDRLRSAIQGSDSDPAHKQKTLAALDEYQIVLNDLLATGALIQGNLAELDRQDENIATSLLDLLVAVNEEIQAANEEIRANRSKMIARSAASALTGLSLAIVIMVLFHLTVTRKITKLTKVARELEASHLSARAIIDSQDEVGELAETINMMAENLEQTIDRLETLHSSSVSLAQETSLDGASSIALLSALKLGGAETGFIGILQDEYLRLVQVAGNIPPGMKNSLLSLEHGDLRRALDQGQPVISEGDVPDLWGLPAQEKFQSRIMLPLIADEQAIGILNVEARKPGGFSPETVKFLSLLAASTAVSIRNKIKQAAAERMATIDPLTGLYNRRGLFEHGIRAIYHTTRSHQPISAIFLDIDHFKTFNDQYSYEIGDFVLTSVARLFLENVRRVDLVGRYGGEEFIVLMPDINLEAAAQMAERLRKLIETQTLQQGVHRLAITISAGVAELSIPEDETQYDQNDYANLLTRLIEYSGQMVHKAKNDGRNRVAIGEALQIPQAGASVETNS